MPLHFEPRLLQLHIDKEAIDEAFARAHWQPEPTWTATNWHKTAAKMAVLVKSPERVGAICADIAQALSGESRAEWLRRAGGHIRPRELRAVQAGARPAPAA